MNTQMIFEVALFIKLFGTFETMEDTVQSTCFLVVLFCAENSTAVDDEDFHTVHDLVLVNFIFSNSIGCIISKASYT